MMAIVSFLKYSYHTMLESVEISCGVGPSTWSFAGGQSALSRREISIAIDSEIEAHTVDILFDTSKVNCLHTSNLLAGDSCSCADSSWSGRGIDSRDEGSTSWGIELSCQWGAKSSRKGSGCHDCELSGEFGLLGEEEKKAVVEK